MAQFNQAILNIVTNALEVLSEREVRQCDEDQPLDDAKDIRKDVSLAENEVERSWVRITTELGQERESIVIQIVDNGPGIDQEHQTKIFDPFFTTKPIGEGTGLGLSIAYQAIVKQNSGSMEYFDNDPTGAGFRITLPLKPQPV